MTDYLSEKEAAEYCRVSLKHFRAKKADYGIMPGVFMGKKIYRRADLQRAIESGFIDSGETRCLVNGRAINARTLP